MKSTVRKIAAAPKKKRIKKVKARTPQTKPIASTQNAVSALWKEDVASFKDRRFASLDQAREAFIERVLNRMGVTEGSRQKVAQFLLLTLEDDPAVNKILEKFVTPQRG